MMKYIDWKTLLFYLFLLEFIVSLVALFEGHLAGNQYFNGVGVGLIIAWVTTGLAYLINTQREKAKRS